MNTIRQGNMDALPVRDIEAVTQSNRFMSALTRRMAIGKSLIILTKAHVKRHIEI